MGASVDASVVMYGCVSCRPCIEGSFLVRMQLRLALGAIVSLSLLLEQRLYMKACPLITVMTLSSVLCVSDGI